MKKFMLPLFFLLFSFSIYAQWVVQTSPVTSTLWSVSVVDQNVAWIGGASGVILKTTDGGTTWTAAGSAAITASVYLNAINANTVLACSNPSAAEVYRTTDAGATWTKVLEQANGFFDAIAMFSDTHGILVGDPVGGRWAIFKTTNGGATWDSTGMYLAQAGTEAGWGNSLFVMGNHVYFGTDNSRIYHSSTGGTAFSPMTISVPSSRDIWFNSPTRGMVSGSVGTTGLTSTTDGGATWTDVTTLGSGTIYSVIGYGNNWFHTRGTRLFYSTDDGATWDTVNVVAPGNLYSIAKAKNGVDVAFAVGASGSILKGTNIGLPVELTSFTAAASNGCAVLNWTTATEVNNRGFEIERSTYGSEFVPVGFVKGAGTSTEKQNYSFTDQTAPGIYTYRLKQIDFNGSYEYSQIIEVDLTGGLSYVLEQNYPNPFNPLTNISFITKEQGQVCLKVYNILGDEVATLVNGQLESGTHTIPFDASSLSSGVYFYTLTAGNFTETKKMLLMK